MSATVLVLNSGSSSIKYELVDPHRTERVASGFIERIGEEMARVEHDAESRGVVTDRQGSLGRLRGIRPVDRWDGIPRNGVHRAS